LTYVFEEGIAVLFKERGGERGESDETNPGSEFMNTGEGRYFQVGRGEGNGRTQL
jgi:hypothetical protein